MNEKPLVHIVDNDPVMLASAWFLLSTEGLDVRTYPSALDFLRRLEPGGAACLVTAVQMPVMTGIDLLTILADLGLDLPAIVLSRDDPSVVMRARKAGAVDVVGKSLAPEALVAAVREALRDEPDWEETLLPPVSVRWLQ